MGDQLDPLVKWHLGFDKDSFAVFIHAVNGKYVLGKINSDCDNSHGFPLSIHEMRDNTPSWHFGAVHRNLRHSRDGEVPFIRWVSQTLSTELS